MSQNKLLKKVKKELSLNPKSYDHALDCWTRFINAYPRNKEFIANYCYESLFQLENYPHDYSIKKPLPIMVAIATSRYFNEILFGDSSVANHNDLKFYQLFDFNIFYISSLFFLDESLVLKFNDFFREAIVPLIDWDAFLVRTLLDSSPSHKFINNVLNIAIDYLFRFDALLHFPIWPSLESRHYFKLISLGFLINIDKLIDKIIAKNFTLLDDKSWKRIIVYFYHNKALTPHLKRLFKTSKERNFIVNHLGNITSNNTLMLLIMI
jgi:hypothetical protein